MDFVLNDEVFKDPSTFDFLTQFGNSQSLCDLRKESLYIKFDPLLGSPRSANVTDKPLPELNIVREKERDECKNINLVAGVGSESHEVDFLGTVESFLRSKTPMFPSDDTKNNSAHLRQEKYQGELVSLKAEVMKLEEIIKKKEEAHKNEVAKYTSERVSMEFDLTKQQEIVTELRKELNENKVEKLALDSIMTEYEKVFSHLVAEKEQNIVIFGQKETKLMTELQECQKKLADKEQELSEVERKYDSFRNNVKILSECEAKLRAKIHSYEKALEIEKQKYNILKDHAASQLESANEKLLVEDKRYQFERTKNHNWRSEMELKVKSLQEQVEQKTAENKQLMAMCTELMEQFK